jgi:hypothetical protein
VVRNVRVVGRVAIEVFRRGPDVSQMLLPVRAQDDFIIDFRERLRPGDGQLGLAAETFERS